MNTNDRELYEAAMNIVRAVARIGGDKDLRAQALRGLPAIEQDRLASVMNNAERLCQRTGS